MRTGDDKGQRAAEFPAFGGDRAEALAGAQARSARSRCGAGSIRGIALLRPGAHYLHFAGP